MSVADLLAEHGSPLWLTNLDVVRDRQRAFTAAWRAEWPDVEIAYSHKANRLPAILRALAEKGIGHQVACEAEYCLARSVADASGRSIVVQGRRSRRAARARCRRRRARDRRHPRRAPPARGRRHHARGRARLPARRGPRDEPLRRPHGRALDGTAPRGGAGLRSKRSPSTSCRPDSTARWRRSRGWRARWWSSGRSRPSASPRRPRCSPGWPCAWACPSSTSAAASRPPRRSRPTPAP